MYFIAALAFALMLTTCALAVFRGSAPERVAAGVVALAWLGDLVGHSLWRSFNAFYMVNLLSDLVVAATLLLLAVRCVKPWLAPALILQGLALSANGLEYAQAGWGGTIYSIAVTVFSNGVLLCIAAGSLSARHGRQLSPA